MPSFTTVNMQQCKDISLVTVNVGDYRVSRIEDYMFNTCTCKGFKFRKTCKHLEIAQKSVCQWHQMTGIPQGEKGICPECGGETETVAVAV